VTRLPDGDLAARLGSVELLQGFDEPSRRALASELEVVQLAAGETLVRQGDDADSLFVILEGRLAVRLDREAREGQALAELGAGDLVGEVALIAGGKRSATVTALEPSTLARLPVAALTRLQATRPELASRLADLVSRRLREAQLAAQLARLFDTLDPATLAALQRAAEWVSLPAGEALFRQGDAGDAAYLVVTGRLRILTRDPQERVLNEVGRGEMVGEMALLEGVPRMATALATRDTDLARIPRAAFEELIERHPKAMLEVARTVVRRARAPVSRLARRNDAPLSIAIVPTDPSLATDSFVTRLQEALRPFGSAIRLHAQRVDELLGKPGIANGRAEAPSQLRLRQWLNEIEDAHRFVIYEADPKWTPWSQRCIEQADHLISLGDARSAAPTGDTESHVATTRRTRHARWSLVLLHEPQVSRPAGTADWLRPRDVESVYHVRRDHPPDLQRLARILAGRAVGLVLGGGGARGFAHLGVLRAFEDLGIPIDMVGGASIGAPMAAGPARGLTAREALAEAEQGFASILDYTLPVASLLAGRRIMASIERSLGSWDIEDLWLPYFCLSTNISRAGSVVHRRGNLARAVRASVAIPGVLPPVPEGEDLLVDGAVLNNLPIDVMRELNPTGPVIAVDVVPPQGPRATSDYGLMLSGWKLALGRLRPGRPPSSVPSIAATILHSMFVGAGTSRQQMVRDGLADLYLDIHLRKVGLLEFDRVRPIEELGHAQAIERLREWIQSKGLLEPGSLEAESRTI
jgi:CRP-like cAMP-binding protein/predicted acylesterase/phospholipase RssA